MGVGAFVEGEAVVGVDTAWLGSIVEADVVVVDKVAMVEAAVLVDTLAAAAAEEEDDIAASPDLGDIVDVEETKVVDTEPAAGGRTSFLEIPNTR